MHVTFEQMDTVGIFTFVGELTSKYEDNLKMILMKAIYGTERAVLNFRKVSRIDDACRNLLRTAYCTSVRLKNPIIFTEIPSVYLSDVFNCDTGQGQRSEFQAESDHAAHYEKRIHI